MKTRKENAKQMHPPGIAHENPPMQRMIIMIIETLRTAESTMRLFFLSNQSLMLSYISYLPFMIFDIQQFVKGIKNPKKKGQKKIKVIK